MKSRQCSLGSKTRMENFIKANFTTAANTCRNQGGHLAFFINETEYNTYVNTERENDDYELLGYYSCDHPNFVNVDGQPSRYENWADGEPNNQDGIEFCNDLRKIRYYL